jgi:hypothetical protein
MKKILLVIITLLLINISNAQIKESRILLYKTTADFMNDSIWDVDAIALIKEQNESYIKIKQIIDPKTRKRLKKGISAWAIKYNGIKYFNLGYSNDLNNWKTYVKFNIIGKYSAIIIDKNTPNAVKNGRQIYGGGLTGVLIGESRKWNKNWIDKNGEKEKILFIDTNQIKKKNASRNAECSLAYYLTRKKLKEIVKDKFPDINLEKISYEKVIEIIKELNE